MVEDIMSGLQVEALLHLGIGTEEQVEPAHG